MINTIDDLKTLLDREPTADGRLIQAVVAQAATVKDYASQLGTAVAANSLSQVKMIATAMMDFAKSQEQAALVLGVPPTAPKI